MRKTFECGSLTICLASGVYLATVLNLAFWRYVVRHIELVDTRDIVFAASLPIAMCAIYFAVICLLFWPYVGKGLLAFLFIAGSAANYFMFTLNVHIDTDMVRNVFATNPAEAGEMVTASGVLWVLAMGVVPAVILLRTRVVYRPAVREVLVRLGVIVACLVGAGLIGGLLFKDYSATARNNKMITKLISPSNYVGSVSKFFIKKYRANRPFSVIDEDPNHMPYEDPYYTVLILMIGETARAMNFSLNGYERDTNPKLSRQDIINFPDVTASGTATAFALPCMFSHLPRHEFKVDDARHSENLLDVMQKAGYDVIWFDNDGGSKGVSDRVPTVDLMKEGKAPYRNGETCYDEVLLGGLEERLAAIDKDTVIVLHMMGSHGPSYYRRYPEQFRVFTPTCDSADIQNSPREEIVNTYDNTILYTDHVVSGAIDILKRFPQHEAGLLYVSDHGESLGENGLYLHGFPYAFAPAEQTRVPMVLWMSETMRREDHVDYEKLRAASAMPLSHDNLFHSVLGLVEIETDLYDPRLDLFREFRTKAPPFVTAP